MKILDLYIGKNFLKYFCIVLIVPGVVFSFFELLSQLDDVGRGSYTLGNALFFVLLTLPKRLQDLMPMSTLLGAIVSMGILADNRELLAMEASGISVLRISFSLLAACTVLMLISGLFGETIGPQLEQRAYKSRVQALTKGIVTPIGQGFWARRQNSYIHVDKILGKGIASDIDIFEFDIGNHLKAFIHANSVYMQENSQWVMKGVTQKIAKGMKIETKKIGTLTIKPFLSTDQVTALELPADSLPTADLLNYIDALRKNGQNTDYYSLALWQKLSLPLTTAAMALLALNFVFGSIREMGAGIRITIGSFAAIILYFGNQVIMHIGIFLGLPPFIVAMIPVAVISTFALIWLHQSV